MSRVFELMLFVVFVLLILLALVVFVMMFTLVIMLVLLMHTPVVLLPRVGAPVAGCCCFVDFDYYVGCQCSVCVRSVVRCHCVGVVCCVIVDWYLMMLLLTCLVYIFMIVSGLFVFTVSYGCDRWHSCYLRWLLCCWCRC